MSDSVPRADIKLLGLLRRHGARLQGPVVNAGCGDQRLGDVRLDFAGRAANVLADVDSGLPLRRGSVGTIFSRNLLEHLTNVGAFLHEARSALRPGGQLITLTDNAGYLTFHFAGTRPVGQAHRPTGYHGAREDDRHYALFTDAHLENHLLAAGFRRVQVHYVDAVSTGHLPTLPPLQRIQSVLEASTPAWARYTRPYLTPHLLAIAERPGS